MPLCWFDCLYYEWADVLGSVILIGLLSTIYLYEKYRKKNNLKSAWFFSLVLFHHHWMITYDKFTKQFRSGYLAIKRKVTFLCMRYEFIIQYPTKIMEVQTPLNTKKVKLPVTSRVNPSYVKCIYMVEK